MFCSPPVVKRLSVSLTHEEKIGWEYGGVVGGQGCVYSSTTAYTLSYMTLLDSLMCTACKRDIICLMSKLSATTACISFDKSCKRKFLPSVMEGRC